MTNRLNITTNRPPNRAQGLTMILLVIAASAPASAHGGFDHIRGTVVKVANNVLTVKTAKGYVDVKLDNKTELTKNEQKAQLADLKPGARVIVEVPQNSKDKIVHSVKIGASSQPAPAAKRPNH